MTGARTGIAGEGIPIRRSRRRPGIGTTASPAPGRAGRAETLCHAAALAERPREQRETVFLIAADVADQDGMSAIEAVARDEIATALGVDKAALLAASPVRRPVA